jgi:iron complex outermembrane receptor protein
VEVGYRLSDYSSTGTHPTYKTQASWAPSADLKVRVGFNRATRSPNINELFTPQGLGLGGSTDICAGEKPTATQAQCALMGVSASQYGNVPENPAQQYNTLGGGNPNLSPEVADTVTGGLVITPKALSGFTAAFDYYNIKIKNTIGTLGSNDILNQCAATGSPLLCGLVHRDKFGTTWATNAGYVTTTNQNVGKRNVEGIDVNTTYAKPLGGAGLFTVNLIGTYLMQEGIDTGLYAYDCVGYFGNTCGNPAPKWRHLARFSLDTKFKTTISVGWRMIGAVTVDDANPNPALSNPDNLALDKVNNIDKIPAFHYMDLGATWKMTRNAQLVLGVNNLFDKEPPLAVGQSNNDYAAGFYGTYDSLGRFFHTSLQFKF